MMAIPSLIFFFFFIFWFLDRVFGPDTSTQDVYEVAARPVVKAAMEGINGMIIDCWCVISVSMSAFELERTCLWVISFYIILFKSLVWRKLISAKWLAVVELSTECADSTRRLTIPRDYILGLKFFIWVCSELHFPVQFHWHKICWLCRHSFRLWCYK